MPLVKLYANLRRLAGTKELSIPGGTVGTVLNELIKRNPALEGVILESEKLRPHVVVTLNGYNIIEISMQVAEQDIIAVFPPIAGG